MVDLGCSESIIEAFVLSVWSLGLAWTRKFADMECGFSTITSTLIQAVYGSNQTQYVCNSRTIFSWLTLFLRPGYAPSSSDEDDEEEDEFVQEQREPTDILMDRRLKEVFHLMIYAKQALFGSWVLNYASQNS